MTWFEFQVYPGHTYLHNDTKFYVPMLERLDTPGFLSRDLVATNPVYAYTIYDEVTRALHQFAHQSFKNALAGQQLLFRFAAILGVYLLLRPAGVATGAALIISALINATTFLAAPGIWLTNPEPVPGAFALSLVVLALGCLADDKPLLGSFAAGVAFLYDPLIGGSLWLALLSGMVFQPNLRKLWRPTLPVLLVFVLLLANLSQLQPGVGSVNSLVGQIPSAIAELSRMRTPGLWPSLWAGHALWNYLFLFPLLVWAAARISSRVNQPTRWLVASLACAGLLSVPLSWILLEGFHLDFALQMPPQRLLVFVVAMAMAACGAAACQAFADKHFREAAVWSALIVYIAICPEVFTPRPPPIPDQNQGATNSLRQLADWAERDTWGSSMFQFPDAGRGTYPGMFRALSRRALWADWQSGVLLNYSDEAGLQWWKRWRETMQAPYTATRLQELLSLPVDYYVLTPAHRLQGIRVAFENNDFVAYDAQDLRRAPVLTQVDPKPLN